MAAVFDPVRHMGARSLGRRELIAVLTAVPASPAAGHAQQPEPALRIGLLMPWTQNDPVAQASMRAFAEALGRFGWNEGRNIRIDYRFAANDPALVKTYAAELGRPFAERSSCEHHAHGHDAAAADGHNTDRFVLVLDPVGLGLVQSFARPGDNITGFGALDPPLMGKWLQLLKEVAPGVTRVAVIFNPETAPYAPLFNREIEAAAPTFGVTIPLPRFAMTR